MDEGEWIINSSTKGLVSQIYLFGIASRMVYFDAFCASLSSVSLPILPPDSEKIIAICQITETQPGSMLDDDR